MRKIFTVSLLLMTIAYVLPFVYQGVGSGGGLKVDWPQWQSDEQQQTEETAQGGREETTVSVLTEGEVRDIPMTDYLAGVLAAEMPAGFPEEALRAQAVAARTYTYYKIQALENGGSNDAAHQGAVVCDDYTHCKAYLDLETRARERWGDQAEEYTEILYDAVESTAGEIVTYEEQPIAAVFHSTSSEKTESAEDVWGSAYPYLVSVDSPGGEDSPEYEKDVTFSAEEFRKIMQEQYPTMDLSGAPNTWFADSNRSEAGGVIDVEVGGVRVKGTQIRTLLGLNSTNFTLTTTGDSITFHTIGYGHGVGLSQYGAKALAEQGKTYAEILAWYYPGTTLEKVS